ncbi:MAG: VCBS domain-containing protein [Pirellulaceae bacterium]
MNDICVLNFATTTAGSGSASATATMVFQGSDLGLDTYDESIRSIALVTNRAPTIDGSGSPIAYTENASGIGDTSITLADVDDTYLQGATISITSNFSSSEDLLSFNPTFGISGSYNASTGVMTLSGTATVSQYEAALRQVLYSNSSESPSTATRTLSYVTSDASDDSTAYTTDVTITAVNDTPVVTAPASAYSFTEQGSLIIHGTGFSVADVDDNGGTMTATFSVGEGRILIDTGDSGVSVTSGAFNTSGNSTDIVKLTGTVAQINALLSGSSTGTIVYYHDQTVVSDVPSASTTITLTVNDQGNTGSDPGLTADATSEEHFASQTINITSVNDSPEFIGPNLITNGTFDTDLSGWSTTGTVTSGSGRATFGTGGNAGPHTLSQTIATNIGDVYVLEFDYRDGHASLNQQLQVTVDGSSNVLTTQQILSDTDGSTFVRYRFEFTADSTTSTLTFTDTSDDAGSLSAATNGVDSAVDNISVRQVNGQIGTANYTEDGSAVVLDSDVTLFDAEINAALDNFDGTTLTLLRNGGANGDDVFSATGNLVLNAGTLELSSINIGSYTNAGGQLSITFNATATSSQVNEVLQSITYSNSNNAPPSSVQIDWTFNDNNAANVQGTGGALDATGYTIVQITSTNDAPVMDNAGNLRLPTITEDDVNNAGVTVAQMLASDGGNPITDVDSDAFEGIAITTRNNGRGLWEYSIDGGATWGSVGTVSETEALLLRSTDLIRFAPDGQNGNTTDRTLEFRAWDQTSGTAGMKVDTTTNGGSTAFSTAIETVAITTTDVNDAPVLDNSGSVTLTTQQEDAGAPVGAVGTVITDLVQIGGNVTDVDASPQTGVAITAADTTNGTWWYTTDSGATWNALGSVSESSARVLNANSGTRIYFQSNMDFNGTVTDAITFRAWDRSLGPNGSIQDASTNGGTTAFSADEETANLTITAINDAPSGGDNTVSTLRDTDYVFSLSDFGYSDVEGDSFTSVYLTTGTTVGTIFVDTNSDGNYDVGEELGGGATVLASDIAAGKLRFAAVAGESGSGYDSFTFQVIDNGGTTNGGLDTDASPNTLTIDVNDAYRIEGNIFEDVNGDAQLGDAVLLSNVTVHLYQDVDDDGLISAADTLYATTTTDVNGFYRFSSLANDTYFVVVDSRTIAPSAGLNGTFTQTDVWAEQTYGVAGAASGAGFLGSSGALFGGRTADVSDNASSLLTAEHVTRVALSGGDAANIDAGFSFNVVTGVRDGDDVGSEGRSVQGSLRQFVTNANAIVGANAMRFVPGVATNSTDGSGSWWTIQLTSALSGIVDDGTVVDGTAFSYVDGTTVLDSNAGQIGSGGTVGLGADGILGTGDDVTISQFNKTELEVIGAANASTVLSVSSTASDFELHDLAIRKLSDGVTGSALVNIAGGGAVNVSGVLFGISADGTAYNTTGAAGNMLTVSNAVGGTISNNYFVVGDTAELVSAMSISNGSNNSVSGNELLGAFKFGISAYSDNSLFSGNLVDGVANGFGIGTFYGPRANVTIENNTVRNTTGYAAIAAGFGSNDVTIRYNIVHDNLFGIHARPDGGSGYDDANNAVFSMNSVYDNGDIGIDVYETGVNDGVLDPTAPNEGIDHPIITTANLAGGNLALAGYVGAAPNDTDFANARIEFFVSDGSGEGKTYLGFLTTDANGNFSGVLAVSGVVDTDSIVATATMTGIGSSEFGNQFGVNVAPVITVPAAQTASEDVSHPISGVALGDADTNVTSAQLAVTNGSLTVTLQGSATISSGSNGSATLTISGTQADINSTLATLAYLGNTNYNGADTLNILATDAGGLTDTDSVNITVNPVNDAPVMETSYSTTLTSITEDQSGNAGQTVASVLASSGQDIVTDVDSGAVEGIAIIATSAVHGTWQYSLDGGTNWLDFGSVSNGSALLLRSTDLVRFNPDGQQGSSSSFGFRAWDQTSGDSAGDRVNITATGGTTAFSSNVETALITVTQLNDAPTITDGATYNFSSTNEDTTSAAVNVSAILAGTGYGDVDPAPFSGVAITSTNGNGTWEYSTDGVTWNTFGAVSTTNALLLNSTSLIRYTPDGLNGETATFEFQAWDQVSDSPSTNTVRQFGDATANGGTTAYSTQSATGQIVVTDVNDAVVASADADTAVEAGGVANGTAGTNPSGNVLTNDTDVDNGDTKTVTGVAAGSVSLPSGSVGSPVNGAYGSITINSDGSYTYNVDNNNAAVQALRTSGNTLTDTFTYTVTDGGSGSASTQIVLTIQGQNDAPVAVADSVTATEAGGAGNASAGFDPTGNVLINDTDVDAGETKTVTGVVVGSAGSASGNVGSALVGTYGSITLNANGSYTYTVDNSNAAVQALRGTSDTLTETFTYTMVDADGASSTTQLTVTIEGQNDDLIANDDTAAAVEAGGTANGTAGTNPSGNVLTNDTDVDAGDTKTVIGVLFGSQASASGNVASGVNGSYGSITINADGSYTYTVDNTNAAVQALRTSGQSLSEVFTYTAQDTAGATSTAEITVTITGSNDAPVAVANTATAIEASGVYNNISGTNPTGNVLTNDTDVDAGDTKTVVGVDTGTQASTSGNVGVTVTGTYGSIVLNGDGTYTYTLDNNNATVEALNDGDTLTETFSYTVADTDGLESTTQLTVTIQGRTDMPVAIVDMATAVEDGGVANASTGSNPSGNVLDNDVSGNGKTVVGVEPGDTGLDASGNVGSTVIGSYGSVVINSDGTYSYTLDNTNPAVEALLTSGDHVTDVFTYTMEDSFGNKSTTKLTITVDGSNDNPVGNSDTGSATEAGGLANATAGSNATGNVLTNDTDVDSGDTKTVVGVASGSQPSASGSVGASVTGTYGSIVINNDGSYTYAIDESNSTVQALRTGGDTLSEVFTYTMEDTAGASSTAEITITIHGANDTPTAVVDTAAAYEAGGVANGTAGTDPTGNVLTNDTDVDASDTKTIVGVSAGVQASAAGSVGAGVAGNYGTITINSDGSYTYNVDNSNATVQALRTSGQTLTDTFTYTFTDTDGLTSTSQITVTVHGANDAINAVADTATAVEAGGTANGTAGTNPTGNVLINDTDVDAGDTKTVSGVAAGTVGSASGSVGTSVSGAYGSISISSGGAYTYTVDNANAAVQALLSSSDTLTDTFTYTVVDAAGLESTTQITITIQGADDAPQATADTGSATEAGGIANGTVGSNATGNVLTNDAQIDAGDSWTVDGVAAGSVGTQTTGTALPIAGNYGTITINSDGSYSYVIDDSNATVQALRTTTNTLTDTFTYTVKDAGGQTSTTQIVLTIHGSNDNPVAVADTAIAVEAGGVANGTAGTDPTGNVLSNDTDVDAGDSKMVAGVAAGVQVSASGAVGSSVTGSFGAITINSDGSYSYSVDNTNATVQALRTSGDTLTDIFTYTVVDAGGATSTSQITVTIQGSNDAPVAQAGVLAATEDGGAVAGTLTNVDVDSGETHSYTLITDTVEGTTTVNANGTYSFDPGTAFQDLADGETRQVSFTYEVTDLAGAKSQADVTITVTGTNDVPVFSVEVGDSVAETLTETDTTLTSSGMITLSDNDLTDLVSTSVTGVTASGTTTGLGSNNAALLAMLSSTANVLDATETTDRLTWDFNSGSEAFDYLASGETLTLTYTITATDSQGAMSTQNVILTINGTNDAPAITIEAGDSAADTLGQTGSSLATAGTLTVSDSDLSDLVGSAVSSVSATGNTVGLASNNAALLAMLTSTANVLDATEFTDRLTWNFNSGSEAFDYLSAGESLTLTYTITVTDSQAATHTQDVAITITGSNDAPVITVEVGDSAAETLAETDTTLTSTGTLTVSDTNLSDTVTSTVTGVVVSGTTTGLASNNAALLAMLSSTANVLDNSETTNTLTWDFNSGSEAFDYLASGESLTLTYTIEVADSQGASDTQTVIITINGTADAPVITGGPDSVALTETDSGLTSSGTLTVTDLDLSDNVLAAVDSVAVSGSGSSSVPGTLNNATLQSFLTVSPTAILDNTQTSATLTWDFNSGSEAFDFLAAGETLVLMYTVGATDDDGTPLSDTETVTVTITGSNDTPDILVSVGDSAAETLTETNATLSSSGTLTVNDADLTDVVTSTVTGVVASGTTTGLGSNNAALLAMFSSTANVLDATELTDQLTWNFNSGSEAFDYLASGESLTLTYTIEVIDSQGATDTQTVTITINGTGDAPVITGGPDSVALTETDSGLTSSGTLTITDLDLSNNVLAAVDSVAVSGSGSSSVPGTLDNATLQSFLSVSPTAILDNTQTSASLTWDFNSGSEAFDFLAAGETLVLTYTVSATDDSGTPLSDTEMVTVTITGSNDTPDVLVSVGDSAAEILNETNTTLTSTGTLTVNDSDLTDVVTSTVTGVVASGTTTGLGSNNAALLAMFSSTANVLDATELTDQLVWDFNSGSETFSYLADGESLTLTYTIQVIDRQGASDTQTVVITINGGASAPIISGGPVSVGLAEADAGLSSSGTFTVTDLDQADTVTAAVDSVAVSGTGSSSVPGALDNATLQSFLTVSPSAILDNTQTSATLTWDFNSGSEAFDFLAAGETLVLTYTVSATDDSGTPLSDTEMVTVTITGSNDTPDVLVSIGDSAAETLNETNTTLTSTGTLTVNDSDLTDVVTSTVTGVVASGTTTGLGSNNAALLAMFTSTASVLDATELTDQLTWDFNSGSEAFDYLASGESLTLTYTIEVTDSQGATDTQTVSITINGTGDTPVITGGPDSVALTETDSGLTSSGTLTVTDLDRTDNVLAAVDSVAVSGSGSSSVPGTLDNATLQSFLTVSPSAILDNTQTSATLTWDFNSGSEAFDFLAAGETLVLTYTVSATDDDGTPLSDKEMVSVTITGTNDTPDVLVSVGDSAAETLNETNTTLTSTGTLTVNDSDLTDVVTSTVTGVVASGTTTGLGSNNAALLAMFTATVNVVDATETVAPLSWDFNSGSEAFDYLASGESLTLTYTITVTDSEGATDTQHVVISINGTNDEQVLQANTGATFFEGSVSNTITSAMLATTDVDNSEAERVYTITSITSNGTLELNGVVLGMSDTFTQADIAAGRVRYSHNDSETSADSFGFEVDDGLSAGVCGNVLDDYHARQ